MQFRAAQSTTTDATLDDVIAALSASELVAGVLLMGSTGSQTLTPTSDLDVLLVFAEVEVEMVPHLVVTSIDHRLSEIYCTTIGIIEQVVNEEVPWPDVSEQGVLVTWLKQGRIVHDADRRLTAAQQRALQLPAPRLPGNDAIYEAWRKIGYNVAQIRRYLSANDPMSDLAIDLRLLYSLDEVKGHHFTVRRLPWRGEKPAIRYWMEHDPEFLATLKQCLSSADRAEKVRFYEQLARLTLAPVGGFWTSGSTVVALGGPFGAESSSLSLRQAERGADFWRRLIE